MNAKVELVTHEGETFEVERGIGNEGIGTKVAVKMGQLLGSATRILSIDSDDVFTDLDWPYRVDLVRSISPTGEKGGRL